MNTITPINFKANYQPMKKISKVVKQEVLPAKQESIKKSLTTKSVFQKVLAVVGLGTLFSSLETRIKEKKELNKYLGDTTGINKMAVKRYGLLKISSPIIPHFMRVNSRVFGCRIVIKRGCIGQKGISC